MAHPHHVLASVNLPDGTNSICVDIFRRDDGSFGFDLFRREPEDGRGWFSIGYFGDRRFNSAAGAAVAAGADVHWLEDAAPDLVQRFKSQRAASD